MIDPDQNKRVQSGAEALNHAWFRSDSHAINDLLALNQIITKDRFAHGLSPLKDLHKSNNSHNNNNGG